MEGLNTYRAILSAPLILWHRSARFLQQQRVATIQTLGGFRRALKVGADFTKRYFPAQAYG